MPKPARRYDIYLPLADNSGRPIANEVFDTVEERLLGRFTGLTGQQRAYPLRGIWREASQVYHDQVIILTVLDFHRGGSTRFIAQLKHDLLRQFDQLEILITEQSLRVH